MVAFFICVFISLALISIGMFIGLIYDPYVSIFVKISHFTMWAAVNKIVFSHLIDYFYLDNSENLDLYYEDLNKILFFSNYHQYFYLVFYLVTVASKNSMNDYHKSEKASFFICLQIFYFFISPQTYAEKFSSYWTIIEVFLILFHLFCNKYEGVTIFSISTIGFLIYAIDINFWRIWNYCSTLFVFYIYIGMISYCYFSSVGLIIIYNTFILDYVKIDDFLYKKTIFNLNLNDNVYREFSVDKYSYLMSVLTVLGLPLLAFCYQWFIIGFFGFFPSIFQITIFVPYAYFFGHFLTFFKYYNNDKKQGLFNFFPGLFLAIILKSYLLYES